MPILNKYFFLALALFIFPNLLTAEAIVNVEDSRKEGQVGFFSKVSVALNGTRGNVHSNFYSVNLRLDNNSENLESFLIMQKSQRKRNQALMADSSFVHGRLIFINDSKYSTEVFIQQGKNPFRRYAQRNVLGVGTRIALSETSRLGLGVLYEDEEDLQALSTETERLAVYYHDKFNVSENIDLNTTLYYQPSFNEYKNDYKASFITSFDFTVNENVKISLVYSGFYDSAPPVGAIGHDEQLSTNFSYSF
ncbi:MAG: DUF481 domain-containing protein [SAR86 cluster bacterium]|nr:DUF481 domain-containing protein [SAR86 cluster bacterium]